MEKDHKLSELEEIDVYTAWRMVPPGITKYFYSVEDKPQIALD